MNRSFHKYNSPSAVRDYVSGLNERWPVRPTIIAHIVEQVRGLAQTERQPAPPIHVLDLACGSGLLAEALLDGVPALHYRGVDFAQPFLDVAQERLARFGDRARLVCADLNGDAWPAQLSDPGAGAQFHAVVSMQSLHDLGGEPQLDRIYALAQTQLVPGGLFLNADLIVAPGEELPDNPGRRSVARHLELLRAHGYQNVECTLEQGGFGVVQNRPPRRI